MKGGKNVMMKGLPPVGSRGPVGFGKGMKMETSNMVKGKMMPKMIGGKMVKMKKMGKK